MRIPTAFVLKRLIEATEKSASMATTYFSVGGGFIVREEEYGNRNRGRGRVSVPLSVHLLP